MLTALLIVALVLVLIAGFSLGLHVMSEGGILGWMAGNSILNMTLEIANVLLVALLK